MKKLLMVLPLVLLLCFSFSCQYGEEVAEEPVVDVELDIEAIKKINDEFDAAFNAGDVERIIAIFADDAVRIPPNAPPLIGKEAIRAYFQQHFDQFASEQESILVDYKVSGDLAFTRGTWKNIVTPKAGGESRTVNGSWVSIYRKQSDGTWKCICNIWSDESLVSPTQSEE
jgi:uncharacterized protein (TIGR02246 family)